MREKEERRAAEDQTGRTVEVEKGSVCRACNFSLICDLI